MDSLNIIPVYRKIFVLIQQINSANLGVFIIYYIYSNFIIVGISYGYFVNIKCIWQNQKCNICT